MIGLRGKGSDTNAGTDEKDGLIVQEVLRSRTKGTVNHHARKDAVKGRVNIGSDDFSSRVAFLLGVEVATDSLGQRACEITDNTDVNGNIVLFRRTALFILFYFWEAYQRYDVR